MSFEDQHFSTYLQKTNEYTEKEFGKGSFDGFELIFVSRGYQ